MSCASGLARFLFILFNFFFWLSGAALLGVGIWVLVDPDLDEYQKLMEDATDDGNFMKVAAYILVGFGTFVFLVGFCGCCGAIRRSKILLGVYITCLVLVCAGELAAGIYVAVYKSDAESKLKEGLTKSIKEHYNTGLQGAWDFVQTELECCGGEGPADYINVTWKGKTPEQKLPKSCCELDDKGVPLDERKCQLEEMKFYEEGCQEAMNKWIDKHSTILIGVGCGIAALEILGLICAICFCRKIEDDKYS